MGGDCVWFPSRSTQFAAAIPPLTDSGRFVQTRPPPARPWQRKFDGTPLGFILEFVATTFGFRELRLQRALSILPALDDGRPGTLAG